MQSKEKLECCNFFLNKGSVVFKKRLSSEKSPCTIESNSHFVFSTEKKER